MITTKQRTVFVVGGDIGYANWVQSRIVDELYNADLVMFTGGADINPSIYGAKAHPTTYFDRRRDEFELQMFRVAQAYGKKIVGICRGAQLLCAMAGGKLVQHQRHPPTHYVDTIDGRKIAVTSAHHQAQYPWRLNPGDWHLIASTDNISPFHWGEDKEDLKANYEVEIAYYPHLKGLAIQGHPEWMRASESEEAEKSIAYHQELVNKLMEDKL